MIDITKAVIAGMATILSALLTLLLKEYFDKKKEGEKYKNVKEEIKGVIYGKWKGSYEQMLFEDSQSFEMQMDLKVSNTGAITGKATVSYGEQIFDMNIKGGFHSERFLKMDYENVNKAILQFGTFVFKLSDDSKNLIGYFVGYGPVSGMVIGGKAVLHKV